MPPARAGSFDEGLRSLERADWEGAGALLRHALELGEPGVQDGIEEVQGLIAQGERVRATQLLRALLRRHQSYADLHYLVAQSWLAELRGRVAFRRMSIAYETAKIIRVLAA